MNVVIDGVEYAPVATTAHQSSRKNMTITIAAQACSGSTTVAAMIANTLATYGIAFDVLDPNNVGEPQEVAKKRERLYKGSTMGYNLGVDVTLEIVQLRRACSTQKD